MSPYLLAKNIAGSGLRGVVTVFRLLSKPVNFILQSLALCSQVVNFLAQDLEACEEQMNDSVFLSVRKRAIAG